MCVWDGTFTPPEEEREALDQLPGWRDDPPAASRRPRLWESYGMRRARAIRAVPAYQHREARRDGLAAEVQRAAA
jgi:hypothetical protein